LESNECFVCKRISGIQEGVNPYFVAELKTGYVVIGDYQYFRGYTLFLCKEHKTELQFLNESFKINYDTLLQFGFEGLILDESSKIKNMSSGVTKAVHKFAKTVNRYYELTGTPAPNSMLEYFSQMKPIDETLLGSSFTSFKAKWFYSYKAGGFDKFDILPEKKEELINIIKQKAIFIAKKDCLDLPAVIPNIIREIPMPKETAPLYKQMKNELYAQFQSEICEGVVENKLVMAPNQVTSLGKLNQLTSGFIIDENGAINIISKAKINVLEEVLEEFGPKQVIIWANYKGDFDMINELLGDNAVYYYGGTKPDDIKVLCDKHYGAGAFDKLKDEGRSPKDIAVKLFKEGKVQYFVGNPQSAAYGLTLTNSSDTVYYGLNYSYEQHSQSRDRTNRYGQKEACTYTYILMKGTIDYALYKCMQDKGDLLYSVLNHLKPESIGGDNYDN
jgi:SNF2 family DNA or RNA helicase